MLARARRSPALPAHAGGSVPSHATAALRHSCGHAHSPALPDTFLREGLCSLEHSCCFAFTTLKKQTTLLP